MEEGDSMDLYRVLDNIDTETDNAIKSLHSIREKGKKLVERSEAVLTPALRPKVKELTRAALKRLKNTLSDVNSELELCEIGFPNSSISYAPVGEETNDIKFLTGESPWDFWLQNEKIDFKSLQKSLLKKHQNDLLEPHLYPTASESICFLDRNKVFRGIILQVNLNSVKVLDCDSNLTRVVARDKIFKVDFDACYSHASTFKCTINKDSAGSESWDSYLRDIFCNALKESSLRVKIVEKLPDSFPTFVVDVWMYNDDGEAANLNEWILNRLLLDVKSLSKIGEFDPDFLSAEALNPFCESCSDDSTLRVEKNAKSTVVENLDKSESDKINNLDYVFNKVTVKFVPIVETNEDSVPSLKQNLSEMVSSSEEISSSCSSIADNKVETLSSNCSTSSNGSKVENNLNWPKQEFQPVSQPIQVVVPRHIPPHIYPTTPRPAVFAPPGFYPPPGFPHQNAPANTNMIPPLCPPYNMYRGGPLQQGLPLPPMLYPQPSWNQLPQPGVGLPQWSQNVNHPVLQTGQTPSSTSWSTENLNHQQQLSDFGKNSSSSNDTSARLNVMSQEFVPVSGTASNCSDLNPMGEKLVPRTGVCDQSLPDAKIHSDSRDTPPPISKEDPVYFEVKKPSSLLKPYDNLMVIISHVESPSEFYVNFVSNSNKYLDKLTKDMFEHYNSKEKVTFNTCQAAQKSLGNFCACKWDQDNHWYRVQVLDWDYKNNRVEVFFLDFGNKSHVAPSCLQPLTKDFSKMSQIAQRCHLNKNPLYQDREWSEESLKFFKSKVLTNETTIFTATVIPVTSKNKPVDNSLSVRLYEGVFKNGNAKSINDMLVECAKDWNPELHRSTEDVNGQVIVSSEKTLARSSLSSVSDLPAEEEVWKGWDPQAEDYHSLRNNPGLDTDDPGVALVGYKAQDEARICRFYADNGTCWKSYCSKEHIRPNTDGVTTDQQEVYNACLSEITMPSVGDEIIVKVTCVESMNQFYVQLEEDRATGMDFDDNEDAETLTSLHEFMNKPENVQKMKKLILLPALGEMVLARFNDYWFRGRVYSTSEEEDPEVMLVDYGNIFSIPEEDLRAMEPRYLHLPYQAIFCTLANIVPMDVDQETLDEATDLLREQIESKVLKAKVYDNGDPDDDVRGLQVLLKLDDGRDLGEYLATKHVCFISKALEF